MAASEEPFALRAQMAADGGLREGSVAGRFDSANLPERVSAEFAGGRATPKVRTPKGGNSFLRRKGGLALVNSNLHRGSQQHDSDCRLVSRVRRTSRR